MTPGRPLEILWLAPYLPTPTFGGGTRVYHLIKAMAATCRIDLVAGEENWEERYLDELRALCRSVHVFPRPIAARHGRRRCQLRSLASRHSAQHWMTRAAAIQDHLHATRGDRAYDVAILEHSFVGCYSLPPHTLTVVDQHNVESEILVRAAKHDRSRVRRLYNRLEGWKYGREERHVCAQADLIVATSERDRDTMASWQPAPPVTVVPNGVDGARFHPMAPGPEGPPNVLFVGAMHYAPNAQAAQYFARSIWPHVRSQVPDATFSIVGGSPPPDVRQLADLPGVVIEGYVPDVRPHLSRAGVVVAPLAIGGGTRLKILEALAMERAVVSTSVGAEGLDVEPGRHLLIADEPSAFAGHVVRLLHDPAERARLGREGRQLVTGQYDWATLGTVFKSAIVGALQCCADATPEAHEVAASVHPSTT